jgi:hypothetical protein
VFAGSLALGSFDWKKSGGNCLTTVATSNGSCKVASSGKADAMAVKESYRSRS